MVRTSGLILGLLVLLARPVHADEAVPPAEAPSPDLPAHKVGPLLVDLGDGVEIDLPAGVILFERTEARAMLEEVGDSPDGVLGIAFRPEGEWSVTIGLVDIGYVRDQDADLLAGSDLLEAMKRGTIAQNVIRRQKGSTELFVERWSQPPAYDRTRRVLSWSIELSCVDGPLLNSFTNVLGRRGYVGVNLITTPERIEVDRADAAATIAGVRYQPGHRYQDFDPAVDKDSGLGLRELVVGGGIIAAVKAGKVGLIAKILLAFKKFFIVIGLAIAGFVKLLLGRRKTPAQGES